MEYMFESDIELINKRLWSKLTLGEFFALTLALSMVGVFLWQKPHLPFLGFDLRVYLAGAHQNSGYNHVYYLYGYWILPIFNVLSILPFEVAFVLWSVLNILGVFFGARVFNGNAVMALLSYQLFYNLSYGNISGFIVGALALCWYGIASQKWHLAGLGIALASAKYQLGLAGSILLVLTAPISWKDRLRVFLVPSVMWLLSLFLYPGWPLQVLQLFQSAPPNDWGSITLWRWLGPWALLFFLPPILLKRSPQSFLALVAAIGLALPYSQHMDLLFLLVLPIGWAGWLGNIGYLMAIYGFNVLQYLFVCPLMVYGSILIPEFVKLLRMTGFRNESSNHTPSQQHLQKD